MAHAKVLARASFELVDGGQQDAGPVDVPTVADDGEELFDELDCTLEK